MNDPRVQVQRWEQHQHDKGRSVSSGRVWDRGNPNRSVTPVCPLCGREPLWPVDEDEQALCGNVDCVVVGWRTGQTAAELLSSITVVDASTWGVVSQKTGEPA
jgi:hypothetical protein